MEDLNKRCPYCGEEILAIAIKCRYCHEWLDKKDIIKEVDNKENTLENNENRAMEESSEGTVIINTEEEITDEGTNVSEENNNEDKITLEEDKSLIYNDEDKINQINKIIENKTIVEQRTLESQKEEDLNLPIGDIFKESFKNDEDYKDPSFASLIFKKLGLNISITIVWLIAACLLFEFGSWDIIWKYEMPSSGRLALKIANKEYKSLLYNEFNLITDDDQSFIWSDDIILIRVNDKFYGVRKDQRYFDSPFIQWLMLSATIICVYQGLIKLFDFDIDDSD